MQVLAETDAQHFNLFWGSRFGLEGKCGKGTQSIRSLGLSHCKETGDNRLGQVRTLPCSDLTPACCVLLASARAVGDPRQHWLRPLGCLARHTLNAVLRANARRGQRSYCEEKRTTAVQSTTCTCNLQWLNLRCMAEVAAGCRHPALA